MYATLDDVRGKRYKPSAQAKFDFAAALKVEKQFAIALRRIVQHIYNIVKGNWEYSLSAVLRVREALHRYSELIAPWAEAATRRMHLEVAARNLAQWEKYTSIMGLELQRTIRETPIGTELRRLMNMQVDLIKSIPRDVAQRVHEMTIKGITEGSRGADVEQMILDSVKSIARWKATLIARTETARTSSVLTQVRAMAVGSTSYIWRTARDINVRPMHRRLEGTVQNWSDPPLCDLPDYHAHPGQIFNCRCHPQPIIG